jgi:hypothetical protein
MNFARRHLIDPIHRVPRLWSNAELARIGSLFDGDIVNVSAWRDDDKDGRRYRDYFPRARSYAMTNFRADMRGLQGWDEEIFLDLEQPLPNTLQAAFDVVYNHTTLEHIYEFRLAFANLCAMSRDAVILVVPWLQPYHSQYGDYWRFSPKAVARLFAENGYAAARVVWNANAGASVYVFAVGVRDPARWRGVFEFDHDPEAEGFLAPPAERPGQSALPKLLLDRARAAARAAGVGRIRRALARSLGLT